MDSYASELLERPDHLGPLQQLFSMPHEPLLHPEGLPEALSEHLPIDAPLQGLLSDRPEILGAIFAQSPEADTFVAAAAEAAEKDTPFESEHLETVDAQTAQVGLVIRQFLESSLESVMLDALIPPSCTEKVGVSESRQDTIITT